MSQGRGARCLGLNLREWVCAAWGAHGVGALVRRACA